MIERIMIEESFFSAPAGSTLKHIPNTRMLQVCDVCGQKKYCDWWRREETKRQTLIEEWCE